MGATFAGAAEGLWSISPQLGRQQRRALRVMDRLNKFLAHAGLGSRRQCEALIVRGRVTIDGAVVRALATRVAPGQEVCIDGRPLAGERLVYWLVNKPRGYLCTNRDPARRPLAQDLVPHVPERVYTVG